MRITHETYNANESVRHGQYYNTRIGNQHNGVKLAQTHLHRAII